MMATTALPFLDCARLYEQHAAAEEHTLCCPLSVHSSVAVDEIVVLFLARDDLPDDHWEVVVARVTEKEGARYTGEALERGVGLSEERALELGQSGMEPTVETGTEVRFDARHIAWIVGDDQRHAKRPNAALQCVSDLVFTRGGDVPVDEAQRARDEKERQTALSSAKEHPRAGLNAQVDAFDYFL